MARQSGIRVAKRLDEVGFSDIVVIRNKVMEMRAAGQAVHAFHGGEPFFETPDAIKQALYAGDGKRTRHATRPLPANRTSAQGPGRQTGRERMGLQATADEVLINGRWRRTRLYWLFQGGAGSGQRACSSRPTGRRSPISYPRHRGASGVWCQPRQRAGRHHNDAGTAHDTGDTRHLLQHAAKSERCGLHPCGSRRGCAVRKANTT